MVICKTQSCLSRNTEDGKTKAENAVLKELLPSDTSQSWRLALHGLNAPLSPPSQSRGLFLQFPSWIPVWIITLSPLKFLPAVSTECCFFASSFEKKPIVSIIGTEVAAVVGKGSGYLPEGVI